MQNIQNLPSSVVCFLRVLASVPSVNRIVLFGSRAIGDNDSGADVDVAVSAPTLTRMQFSRLRVAAYEARTLYWISLVHFEETPRHYVNESNSKELSYMSDRKLNDSICNLERAVIKLEDALKIPKDRELVVEGTIQRFEFVVELMWKTLKRSLDYEGIHPKTPRESLREAFQIGWLKDEDMWLDMLDKRNTTSHLYLDEELAEANYEDIKKLMPVLRETLDFLKNRYS